MGRSAITIAGAWEQLFRQYAIAERVEEKGFYLISSKEINAIKEARLMAKFDQYAQLPEIFLKNRLSILPVTRGSYIIGPFVTHEKITYAQERPKKINLPELATLNYRNLYSEAASLLFAYNSGILATALQCPRLHFTVNGRMASGEFNFRIRNSRDHGLSQAIHVQNAQIEVDAGYESPDAFYVCEAKNIAVSDLLIRQLYYPYRLWQGKINKPVIPLFLIFSNDIFHLFRYEFTEPGCYNSLRLVDTQLFTAVDETITMGDIVSLWKKTKIKAEPDAPFPQANAFGRIMDLLWLLYEKGLGQEDITLKYEFDQRQTHYYISACDYLGFIKRQRNEAGERIYMLTPMARQIMSLPYKAKHLAIISRLFELPVFYRVFSLALFSNRIPSTEAVCQVMLETDLNISAATIRRRASTIRGWIGWILRLAEDSAE